MWTLNSDTIHSVMHTKIGIQTQMCFDGDHMVRWDHIEPMMIQYGVAWEHKRELDWMRHVWSVLEADGLTRYHSADSWMAVLWHAYAICHVFHTFNGMHYLYHEDLGHMIPLEMFRLVETPLYGNDTLEDLHPDKKSYLKFQMSLQTVFLSLINHYIIDCDSDDAVFSLFEALASIKYHDYDIDLKYEDLTLFELGMMMDRPDLYQHMAADKLSRVLRWIKEGFWVL
jgi:hypothetical protein